MEPQIVSRFGVLEFAKSKGKTKISVAQCINKVTGEKFSSVVFHTGDDDSNKVFVCFSSKLTDEDRPKIAAEITRNIDAWQIVQFENGKYEFCKTFDEKLDSIELDFGETSVSSNVKKGFWRKLKYELIGNEEIESRIIEQTKEHIVVDVNEDEQLCPYCGKFKKLADFNANVENGGFVMCKSCEKRDFILTTVPGYLLIFAIFAIAVCVLFLDKQHGMDLAVTVFGVIFGGAWIAGFLYVIVFVFIIPGVLLFTNWRLEIGDARKEFLLKLKNKRGRQLFDPKQIYYTSEEMSYKYRTGFYRRKDVPFNMFACPCCGKIQPIESGVAKSGSDSSTFGNKRVTKLYNFLLCPQCAKADYNGTFYLISFLIELLVGVLMYFAGASGSLIFVTLLILVVIDVIIYWILNLIMSQFYNKRLSINYDICAINGALTNLE